MKSLSRGRGEICYSVRVTMRTIKRSKIEKNICKMLITNILISLNASWSLDLFDGETESHGVAFCLNMAPDRVSLQNINLR